MPKRKISSIDASLGRNLAFFRKLTGMTQQQIADRLNINRTTYTKYETGGSEPSIEMLKRIAKVMDVDVNALVYDESPDEIMIADAWNNSFEINNKIKSLRRQIARLTPQEMKQLNSALEEAGVLSFGKQDEEL